MVVSWPNYKIKYMKKNLTYVDTCILSRIVDLRFSKKIGDAVNILCDIDNVEMVTSPKTLDEFMKATDDKKRTALKLLFKIISKLQKKETLIYNPATWGSGVWGEFVWGGGSNSEDPDYTKIKKIFDIDDADHIYQAHKNNCDYFLTLDKKTILDRAKTYEKDLLSIPVKMKFVNPVDLVEKLSK